MRSFHSKQDPEEALSTLIHILNRNRPANIHESVEPKPDGRGGYRVIAWSSGPHCSHSSVEFRIRPDATGLGSIIQASDHDPDGWATGANEIMDQIERAWFQ